MLKAVLGGLGLAAIATVDATPVEKRIDANGQVVVYWGKDGGNGAVEGSLATYCAPGSGVNIVVLAFLDTFGNGQAYASGSFGNSCVIGTNGYPTNCDTLATDIANCRSAGIKVIVSLGGATGSYGLQSQAQAQQVGQNLWNAFGNPQYSNISAPRPFGSTVLDGWDFDIESLDSSNNAYYPALIAQLRSNFARDPTQQYYITAAPSCWQNDPNTDTIIPNAQFDYIWPQYYDAPACSPVPGGTFNYNSWKSSLANTPSSNAKLFIGLPANQWASTGDSSGFQYYLSPSSLANLVNQYDTDSAFGGVMLWNAGYSTQNVNNGCTYAQEASKIMQTGSPC